MVTIGDIILSVMVLRRSIVSMSHSFIDLSAEPLRYQNMHRNKVCDRNIICICRIESNIRIEQNIYFVDADQF